uniref:ribosomal protein S15 n=1 Tax=Hypericum monogynum TaxID=684760 RepID=UPI0022A7E26B|nr:ribosomal protein S15 [Hypericum monogynum]QVL22970.1 ribosomal protein S15 [Hypericum monogynum]UZS76762.1 ribosomal protein S15 [Hypericum monogynum]
MRKNAFISDILQKEAKRGSLEFQIISLTKKIKKVSLHLQVHKKDYLAERGLRKILGKRQRLCSYLLNKTKVGYVGYQELISQLDIRE